MKIEFCRRGVPNGKAPVSKTGVRKDLRVRLSPSPQKNNEQDQGSVFKAYKYVGKIVIGFKAWISYSRVGTPGDNPEMESFFGRFKVEWRQVFNEAESEDEIKALISKAINYYNLKRIHSAHENMSPDEFLKSALKH